MVKKKKSINLKLLFLFGAIALGFLIFLGIGFIQQSFVELAGEKFVQYNIKPGSYSPGFDSLSVYVRLRETLRGTNTGNKVTGDNPPVPGNRDYLLDSEISDIVTLNSGKNEFSFKSFIGNSNDAIVGSPGDLGDGCYQKIEVSKNGEIIDTAFSWTLTNKEGNIGSENTYFDDDITQNSGIILIMSTNDGGNPTSVSCRYWVNDYRIFLDDESIEFMESHTLSEDKILDVKMDIINNLNNNVLVEGTIDITIPSLLGSITDTLTVSKELSSGSNIIPLNASIPFEEGIISIQPNLQIKYLGSEFSGVNNGDSNTAYWWCNGLSGDRLRCDVWDELLSGSKKKIDNIDWITIGNLVVDEIIIEISPEVNDTQSGNETINGNETNGDMNQTTSDQNKTTSGNETKGDITSEEETSIIDNVGFLIVGVILVVIIIGGVFFFLRKK